MKDNFFKGLCIVAICIAVVGISIAYAALSQTLKITANATVQSKEKSWNVHFASSGTDTGTTTGNAVAGSMSLQNTSVTISNVVLKAPGDSVTYKFKVQNDGEINAKISGYIAPTITVAGATTSPSPSPNPSDFKSKIKYEIFYGDTTTAPTQGTKLASKASANITVKISLDAGVTVLPNQDFNITSTAATITFEQDTSA